MSLKKYFAFTLSEVLITLGIIGVVAAVTMSSIIQNYREKEIVTKVKKFYSILSQGYLYAVQEFGLPSQWEYSGRDAGSNDDDNENYYAENAIFMRDRLLKQVKRVNNCDNAKNQKACGLNDAYYFPDGTVVSDFMGKSAKTASTLLADGCSVVVMANPLNNRRGSGALEKTYAIIYYDINGSKAPNTYGKDVFVFYLTEQNIMPAGTQNETMWSFSNCKSGGVGCTAWVLINENMDYLHCPDKLGWDKARSCKE